MSGVIYKDSHIFLCVSEKFSTTLKQEYGFALNLKAISPDAAEYISGKNTPSETYGVRPGVVLLEVEMKEESVNDGRFWHSSSFPEELLQVIDYFEDETKGEVNSNIGGPSLKIKDGFKAKFRFLVKRDRRWAHTRNEYYLTFLTPEDIDVKKEDERYHDREAEALLHQW